MEILETLPLANYDIQSFLIEHRSKSNKLGAEDYVIDKTFLNWYDNQEKHNTHIF